MSRLASFLRRPEVITAIVNGLVVLLVPLMLRAWSDYSSIAPTNTRTTALPPGVSFTAIEVPRRVRDGTVLLPFAVLAMWRTWVYARQVIARRSDGWRAVAEAAACGGAVVVVMSAPVMAEHPWESLPYLVVSSAFAALLGLVVGVVLRTTALLALRVQART